MDDTALKISFASALADVSREEWNAVANPKGVRYDPFLKWEFLESMESSGAATAATGWMPRHILLRDASGKLKAAMPLYGKSHSRGEFVFDHSWADAFERAGGVYYPKLLGAVPFTPVTGRRFLVEPGPDEARLKTALLSGAIQLAESNELSSLHINFLPKEDAEMMERNGLLLRTDQQFHWQNKEYNTFADFLDDLSSAKRKNLRKERQKAQQGLEFLHLRGDEITEDHLDTFFVFYMDTGSRKWGSPYLTRKAFSLLRERMSDDLLFIFAMENGVPIGGAMNLIGSDTLYGRYWGCTVHRPMLHFETCYYQAIDYAIAHGLKFVEAGAQGGHKLARGYAPVTTHSTHWISHPGLRNAVADYLEREREAVESDIEYLSERTPFKKGEQ
ncbi:MAG: N-acetyltransferase [Alphaproteobacteria bacterium]|nr:GNAT family N-acetyltransferase [Hyphomonas sp.]MBR9805865.1 N-acetyltransferase [Alphaproteobacteria bacterium]